MCKVTKNMGTRTRQSIMKSSRGWWHRALKVSYAFGRYRSICCLKNTCIRGIHVYQEYMYNLCRRAIYSKSIHLHQSI